MNLMHELSYIFLNNVSVDSWQLYSPIVLILLMIVGYALSPFIRKHLLFIYTSFLTLFIPLYPKIPIEGVRNTFVYLRLDDIAVAIGVVLWLFYLVKKKTTWKTPLTIPILIYWVIGLISTVVALIFIFPTLPNVFPHNAILFYLRHIEYLIVYFLAFSAMRDKKYLPWMSGILVFTMLLIIGYGFGQARYPSVFLAYSTMNEQFAKGIPLILQSGARIQATFAGHYDLAAYLVLLIPLIGSLVFGTKKWYWKILFILTALMGLILLLLTASRTSYAVYIVAVIMMLILQKKKIWIVPVLVVSVLLLLSFHTLAQRFADTLTQQSVVIDARTHQVVGLANQNKKTGKVTVVEKTAVGQNLAPGSGYIVSNTQQPIQKTTDVTFKKTTLRAGSESAQITNLRGDFVVQKALAYDDSFTTRFQGEWPIAIAAFLRDPLLGSGYSSIGLASDNNYLRMLGETGLLGFLSFLFIFLMTGIYAYRVLPDVDSPLAKSMVFGTLSGIFGLGLNAILIDVFEASKDAYALWLLLGITIGILSLYQKHKVNFISDLKILISTPAVAVYFLIACLGLFINSLNNFFVADDFTWLRWVADCNKVVVNGVGTCESVKVTLLHFFTNAGGFFYRPMEKLYFYFMYTLFGFNPTPFHAVSVITHWLVTVLIYILSKRLFANKKFPAFLVAVVFMLLSSHTEDIYWISASGHLFVALFSLLAVLFYDNYRLHKKKIQLILSLLAALIAPMFHESGVMASVLVLLYAIVMDWNNLHKRGAKIWSYLVWLMPLPVYFAMRIYAKSIWSAGDYSYNLAKLPLNFFGNILGYFVTTMAGLSFVSSYTFMRDYGKSHVLIVILILLIILAVLIGIYLLLRKSKKAWNYKLILIGLLFFVVPLLPFLGLGNMSPRYEYLASFGIILLVVYLLEKLFKAVKLNNTYALGLISVILVGLFSWYHYIQIINTSEDWTKAGQIAQNSLVEISNEYAQPGSLPPSPVFYFSNVPATYGKALVFPTGMQDAIWMYFQDKNVIVKETPNINISIKEGEATTSARFYEFDKNYNIIETARTVVTITKNKNAK